MSRDQSVIDQQCKLKSQLLILMKKVKFKNLVSIIKNQELKFNNQDLKFESLKFENKYFTFINY